jgi:YVTN family beta-propeller protein
MRGNHNFATPAFWTRGLAALWATLVFAIGLCAWPAEATPFAYVANHDSKNVSVIDTATNKVVATIPVGYFPDAIAVTPDGKRVYVATETDNADISSLLISP